MTADATAGATSGAARPGWYRDPHAPATLLRWWDGTAWTPNARPAPTPAAPPKHAGRNQRIGRLMVVVQSVLPVVETAVIGWAFAEFLRDVRPWLDAVTATPDGQPLPAPPSSFALVAVASVVALLGWAPLILEISWTYRVASTAAALGLPAVREPLWAVMAWFIPVISLWFPYTSVRDSLPAGHPARRSVAWWWGAYLVCGFGSLIGVGAALIGTWALVGAVAVIAAVSVTMAVHGVRMTRAIDEAHAALLASRESGVGSGTGSGPGDAGGVPSGTGAGTGPGARATSAAPSAS